MNRAIPLPDRNRAAPFVREDLYLDMARLEKILFDIDGLISEGGSRFRARGLKGMGQLFFPVHHAHPAAPAARGRLNDDGIADLGRHRCRLLRTGNFAFAPG